MGVVVRVQREDFDVGAELDAMRREAGVGAIASFVGVVRDVNESGGAHADVGALTLEHYPGMTERSIEAICEQAMTRWTLRDTMVVHRVGTLAPTDRIVLVAVSSAHRGDAFAACAFVMDYLKAQAPFWKKETTPEGERWVEARASDEAAAARWAPDAPRPDACPEVR